MFVLVGLGNPGPKYETTRHNAGFLVLDLLLEAQGGRFENSKFKGEMGRAKLLGEDCYFLKPMTYMNKSGESVAALMRFYKVPNKNLIVLHDDIDVPTGKVKAKAGGGHGGNNGIRSIIQCLGTNDFHRIKLGVGRPADHEETSNMEVHDWVLSRFSDQELLALEQEMLPAAKLRLDGIFKNRN